MDHKEQLEWLVLEWLAQEEPTALKAKLLKAVAEFPTSEDVWTLVMEILNDDA